MTRHCMLLLLGYGLVARQFVAMVTQYSCCHGFVGSSEYVRSARENVCFEQVVHVSNDSSMLRYFDGYNLLLF